MRTTLFAALAIATFTGGLTACGASGGAPAVDSATATSPASSAPSATSKPGKPLHIVDSGFGGDREYLWVTALVHNDNAQPGDFVVVNFNVLDAQGQILGSESQTEQFQSKAQDLAMGTQFENKTGKKATRLEVTAAISSKAYSSQTPPPKLTLGKPSISSSYGARSAKFKVTNTTDTAVTGARFGVICKNAAGKINGGGTAYPDLLPPGGTVLVDASYILTSGAPDSCTAYYNGVL